MDVLDQRSVASAQGDEVNVQGIELCQVGKNSKSAVKDEFSRKRSGSGLPVSDKLQNGVTLGLLADGRIRITKDMGSGIACQQRKNATLSPTSFGDKVFLDQSLISMVGDGMKIQVDGGSVSQHIGQVCSCMISAMHEGACKGWIDQD